VIGLWRTERTEKMDAGEGNGTRLDAKLLKEGSEGVVERDEGVAREG
jgi:hypothetical protein